MCQRNKELIPKLSLSGPHVKQSCGFCGKYIKFINQRSVPNFLESRQSIWETTNDLALIEAKKGEIKFNKNEVKLMMDIQCNNLLLAIQKHYL